MADRKHRIELISPVASPAEAAAIVSALERFLLDTAPAAQGSSERPDGWRRAAMLEAVAREGWGGEPDPWINT